ncbi:MAG TPA: polymer-forming cytoskeletal protein [Gemmatimonadaceae bacterium]|nr:polymer-forming cytoskeletal protein [Gemmatimonadaceae bacterium]
MPTRHLACLRAAILAGALAVATSVHAAGAQTKRAPARAPSAGDSITALVDSLGRDPNGVAIERSAVESGPRTVPAGTTVNGSIGSFHGPLDVRGTVTGNAVALGGDVVVHSGGVVRGDAIALGGHVQLDGGTVEGEMRSLSALTVGPLAKSAPRTPAQATKRSLSLAVGWYLVLAVIGLFAALFARGNLENIAERIRDDFSRCFFYGVVGQIAFLPALVVCIVALCITVIGILLIPFAIVGFVLGGAGAIALGFLAMSYMTGEAAMRWRGAVSPYTPPPVVQFLFIGLSLYFVLWMVGGLLSWAGWFGALIRLVAAMVTWVAVTVGFGATLASRGGTRAPGGRVPPPRTPPTIPDASWQTPTPVSGVAAARRPTPPPRSVQR